VTEEEIIRDKFAECGFADIRLIKPVEERPGIKLWVVASNNLDDTRMVDGELKVTGVTVSMTEREIGESAIPLLPARAAQAAITLRALIESMA